MIQTNNKNKDRASCSVSLEGTTYSSNDFVAILSNEKTGPQCIYNADLLTLGLGAQLIIAQCLKSLVDFSKENPEEAQEVTNLLIETAPWFKELMTNEQN